MALITLVIAVMSRRGTLGYQEGSKLRDVRPLPRRAIPVGVFSTPLPRRALNLVTLPVVLAGVEFRLGENPNRAESSDSSRIAMASARRRANTAAMSTGLDNLSLDSGISKDHKRRNE